jgi:hypothetical protein
MSVWAARQLIDIAIPTGIDASEIFRIQMQQGMTLTEIIQGAVAVINDVNNELALQYGGLYVFTERLYARYRNGDGGGRQMSAIGTELSNPDGQRAKHIGHMLPLLPYVDATEWSVAYLKKALREDLRDDIKFVAERWRNRLDFGVITRMLSKKENQIGSSGWDVGWSIGTGTNVNFVPPPYAAYEHTSSHTHYLRTDAAISSTNAATMLELAAQELSHHGHSGRKVALVSEANLGIYLGMDSKKLMVWKPSDFQPITGGSNALMVAEGELKGIPGELFARYHTNYGVIDLRYHPRIPAGYGWMGKSYGDNNPANPLAIRLEMGGGFGMRVNPQIDRSLVPKLDKLKFEAEHGVGVNDRTNGVAFQIAAGSSSYAEPEIS